MSRFIARRLFDALTSMLGVTLFTFFLFQWGGGDPASRLSGLHATTEQIQSVREQLGLHLPLQTQYIKYLKEVMVLDFGDSWATKQNVQELLLESVVPSLSLAFPAFIFATIFSLLLAFALNFRKLKTWDRGVSLLTYGSMSFSFLIVIIFSQYIFAYKLNLFPISGWEPNFADRWSYLALPILTYCLVLIPPNFLIYRSVVSEENSQNYLRTAYSKGLSEIQVTRDHLFKNTLIPVVTLVTFQLPFLFTGAILLESFFGIPGIGGQLYGALHNADLPVIKGITVFSSMIYIFFNTLGDFIYAALDPRVHLQ